MQTLLTLVSFSLCFASPAKTVDIAEKLYQKRSENPQNAYQAMKIYQDLAVKATNDYDKAVLKTKQSLALYYFADQESDKKKKISFFKQGSEVADEAIILLTGKNSLSFEPKNPDHKTPLALAHYASAAHRGKWGSTRGALKSLTAWPTLRKHLDAIIKTDEKVGEYGGHRILGRSMMKLPGLFGGSIKKSEKYLAYAYNKTLHPTLKTSTNPRTTSFYLETLAKRKKSPEVFCKVYKSFQSLYSLPNDKLAQLNSAKFAEIQMELKNFKKEGKRARKYAKSNCNFKNAVI